MRRLLGMVAALFFAASGLAADGTTWFSSRSTGIAPKISSYQDPAHGTVTRCEVMQDGDWQSMAARFEPPVKLKDSAAVEFDLRHNLTQDKISFVLRFEQPQGMVYTSVVAATPQWQKIRVPFDVQSFSPADGNTVVFGESTQLTLYPYEALNKKGLFLEVANLRFIPKTEAAGSRSIKVMNYHHLTKPGSGDSQSTALTDGNKLQNVSYRAYGEEPDIVFDLGGRYAIDAMTINAFAAPSHNFSEISIQSSFDRKNWSAGGILKNTESGTTERAVAYTFKPAGKPVIGRYIRLRAARPRSDFSINLSEVSFIGHTPSEAEFAAAAELNYDTGPAMPERNAANYAELQSGNWQLWISRKNGVVNGAFYKGRLLVERFAPRYTLQSRAEDVEASGYDDKVESLNASGDSVTVVTTNPKLPGLAIERTWRIDDNALFEKVTVLNRSQKERCFLRLATEVIFEQQFRKDGFYEMPSSPSAESTFRLPAAEVQMDRALTQHPTLALENGKANFTVWHLRHRFNDRFTYYDLGSEQEKLQYFRPNGWLLNSACIVPADRPRQSFENRFSVTEGRMLQAYNEYLHLPEVAAFRSQFVRPKWLRDVRAIMAFGWDGNYPESSKRLMTNYKNLFSHRGKLHDPELVDMDGIWGDFPVEGKVRGSFGEFRDATEIRQKLRDIKAFDPRFSIGIYTWLWSAFPWSTPFKNHPEWFVRTLRNGAPASFFPGVNVNYLRFWGIPESRQEAAEQIVRFINYYEQDSWYLDGGTGGAYAKDWETMRIDDPLGLTELLLTIRKEIRKDHPERVLFFNNAETPICDLGYVESFGGTLTNEWRRGATLMWKFKMYNYQDPYHHSIYTYWIPGVDGAFHNYMAGTGVLGAYCSRNLTARDLPYIGARYDLRTAQLCDAHVAPDWRFDGAEELECMTLHQLNNAWIFMHYHGAEPAQREVSADMQELGFAAKEKAVYCWRYTIRDAKKFPGVFGEPQINQDYARYGWVADRGVEMEYLGKRPWSERLSGTFEQQPGAAQLLMASQVPAVVISVENDPVHYYLAGQPGVEVNGDPAKLTIGNEYEAAEIGMILDDGQVPAALKVNGKDTPFTIRTDRNFRCAVFKVGKGDTIAEFTYKAAPPVQTVELKATRRKQTLTVKVTPENAPVEIYCNNALVLSRTGSFELPLPATTRDGEYTVVSGGRSKKLRITGAARPTPVLPLLVDLPDEQAVSPVNKTVRGIEVLNQAHCFSVGAGAVTVDPEKLTLKAGTLSYYESHFNKASAALELQVKSYLKIRITNGVIDHTRYDYEPQKHAVRYTHPGVFAGLNLDFSTPAGYTVRSAAGFGIQTEKRKEASNQPKYWGKKSLPDHVYELNRLSQDAKTEVLECWIDLASLGAPADWDGRIWFTVHTEHLSPDRSFTVEILETADHLPNGVQAVKPAEFGVKLASVVHDLFRISGTPDWRNLPELGTMIPDKSSPEGPGTKVRAAYDEHNLYFFYDCREEPGHILTCSGGSKGAPWEGDSVEFFVQRSDRPEETLHAIIDGAKFVYAENAPFRPGVGKKTIVLHTVPFQYQITINKPHWQVAVTIPWAAIGGKPESGTELGFNLMRNRNVQGRLGFYTLSNNGVYLSGDQCRMVLK